MLFKEVFELSSVVNIVLMLKRANVFMLIRTSRKKNCSTTKQMYLILFFSYVINEKFSFYKASEF